MAYGGNKFGGNKFGGGRYGGGKYGGNKYGASAGSTTTADNTDSSVGDSIKRGIKGMFSSADAAPAPVKKSGPGPFGPQGSRSVARGGSAPTAPKVVAKPVPATGASSGSITKPDASAKAARKAQGDAYLANSSTDYGLGASVNDFANKKKR